jgi:hypothetical protein
VKRLPRSTKSNQIHVPAPQRERIVSKFIEGKGIRQISREEGRSRETVTKIVRSEDVQSYVADLRQQYISLGQLAVATLTRALQSSTDGKLAHQVLVDIGVVSGANAEPLANAEAYDEEREVQVMMGRLVQASIERVQAYGRPLGSIGDGLEDAIKFSTRFVRARSPKRLNPRLPQPRCQRDGQAHTLMTS